MSRVIDRVVDETQEDEAAIDRIHPEIVSRAVDPFAPLHKASAGAGGHVLVQGDPRFDDDVDRVVRDALRYRSLGPNVVVKIPGSLPAMRAIETLVPRGVPLCVTGVFAVAQAVYACELYQKAATGSGQ